jgi:aminoglycoside phosphotransferase (APT) family kinase protein
MTNDAGERTAHYLETVRQACQAVAPSVTDVAERRRLEQAAQVLCLLIVEARAAPALQSQALRSLQSLPMPFVAAADADFFAARAAVQSLLRSELSGSVNGITTGGIKPAAIQSSAIKQVVDIESDYLRQCDAAYRLEAAPKAAVQSSSGSQGAMPDSVALGAYLSTALVGKVEVLKLDTVALGYSKLTLLASIHRNGQAADDLIIRMDRPFNYLETTVVDEYPVLQVLHRAGVRVPRTYALEHTSKVCGQPFLVQARVQGRNIGSHFTPPAHNPALCRKFAQQLAAIHSVAVASFGKTLRGAELSPMAQLTADVDKSYAHWTALGTVAPILEAAFNWLRSHIADGIGHRTLVHGDFSLSNLLISDSDEVAAIVDWEFAALGNPAADLGWFYTGAARLGGWEFFLQAYKDAGGPLPDQRQLDFYVLLGALRLAVMNYQVSMGFESGRSSELKHAAVAAAFQREVTLRVSDKLAELL